jgi:hypothetical protein
MERGSFFASGYTHIPVLTGSEETSQPSERNITTLSSSLTLINHILVFLTALHVMKLFGILSSHYVNFLTSSHDVNLLCSHLLYMTI